MRIVVVERFLCIASSVSSRPVQVAYHILAAESCLALFELGRRHFRHDDRLPAARRAFSTTLGKQSRTGRGFLAVGTTPAIDACYGWRACGDLHQLSSIHTHYRRYPKYLQPARILRDLDSERCRHRSCKSRRSRNPSGPLAARPRSGGTTCEALGVMEAPMRTDAGSTWRPTTHLIAPTITQLGNGPLSRPPNELHR
ncbi:hypothetical protein BD414DRAFT_492401 [Trametes punicea]|nr:hypothetical protein BD414DRAFT_492401 [Trametes punicea]